MSKKIILISTLLLIATTISFSEENVDLNQLTSECTEASKKYKKIQKGIAYKVLHTVEYEGWSGNPDTFNLQYPVIMTIRYAGNDRKGFYWFRDNPQEKYPVSAKTDFNGNVELVEDTVSGPDNFIFRGLMKEGIIKGVWEKGDGKKAFAFYVKVIEKKSNNK